ncbi:transposase domain-containing protein [Haliangium ochraceum]|uniref:transposase domain-containing protein n=1 Tax=Haliangium ochraceum TaxID=80816 RepID=UPI00019BAAAC|nr:transposase domain-containing protein [Haliangium ochraceum]
MTSSGRRSALFTDYARFLVPVDTNAHVERLIRTVAVFRKNCLFVGSLEAGKRYAVLLSLMLECTLADVNPFDYLVDVFDKIAADWPASRATELLPRPWLAARQAQAQARAAEQQ